MHRDRLAPVKWRLSDHHPHHARPPWRARAAAALARAAALPFWPEHWLYQRLSGLAS